MSIIEQGRSMEKWFYEEAARAARTAHATLMKSGGFEALYLYFKRGSLLFAEVAPEGYELGSPQRCPSNLTEAQLIAWTTERSKRLGCLPIEEPTS